jgi:hypothetical protein
MVGDHGPSWPRQKARPYLKYNQNKMGWRCGLSGKCLLSKCEALTSNPTTARKKNRSMISKRIQIN